MKRLVLILALCAALPLGAAIARAETVQLGKLRVSFGGRISPHSLPRDRDAPVRVTLKGTVRTTDGMRPPQLRRMSFAVNRYGKLFTGGLPTCTTGQLESTDTRIALDRCRGALVGRGRFSANLESPNLEPFPVQGRMVAFNARQRRRPAILLHIHASNPIEATVVLTFNISHRRKGKFGTVLTARIPRVAGDLGYVTDVSLVFGRTYTHRGKRRSFLSARCAAPAGFPGALFTFARGSFDFADGKRLNTSLTRDCAVRR